MARGGHNGRAASKRLASWWEDLNSSFWFLPAVLTTVGVLVAFATQPLDRALQPLVDRLPILIAGEADGAASVLSAISGSLITVIATVFSLTMVILTLASGQYSPRLLRSFTADRGLQVVLGVYIGTFVYSLLVLRQVSIAGNNDGFNPAVSVAVSILLALLCVGLLIYFINHISYLIRSSTILEMVHSDTMGVLAAMLDRTETPEEPRDPRRDPRLRDMFDGEPAGVPNLTSGYVRDLDVASVLDAVTDGRTRVVEIPGPGRYVSAGLPLVRAWPAASLPDGAAREVNRAVVVGKERTFQRDLGAGLRQLSDVALKGLSPGINDPTTTMQALDRLEAVFVALGGKALPARVRRETVEGREVLVRIDYPTFDELTGLAFDQVRRAAFTSGQVAVLERFLEVLERAVRSNAGRDRQVVLWERAFAVGRLAPGAIDDPQDAVALMMRAVDVASAMDPASRVDAMRDLDRLVDLAADLDGGDGVERRAEAARRRP